MRTKIILMLLAPLCLRLNLLYGDIIYLIKGEEYEGKVIKIEKDRVFFKIKGKVKKWAMDEVQRLEFEELHPEQWVKELGDPLLDSLCKYAPEYAEAQYITLYEKVSYCINPDSSWQKTTRTIQKLLTPGGRWIASKSFYYLSKSEQLRIKAAKVIHPDGKINWLREAAAKDESIYSRFPIYENQHRIRAALPEIPLGGLCDVSVEQTFPKVSIQHPLIIEECFRDWEPLEYKVVEIACPQDMELLIFKSTGIESDSSILTGTKIYKFWKANAEKIESENWVPPLPDISPRVLVGIKDNWQAIGEKYYSIIESLLTYSNELINKINELQAEALDLVLAQKIYNFVATEIKPIPITTFDEYSWLPSPIDGVFKNKSGTLPDRILLLYGMLKKIGFNVHLVLISPHHYGRRIQEVPSLGQLHSLVVQLEHGNHLWGRKQGISLPTSFLDGVNKKEFPTSLWLCPIDDCTPFGDLPAEWQGGIGLRLSPEKNELVNVPILEPNRERVDKKIYARLNSNGDLEARQMVALYGNFARQFRKKKSLKPEELKKQLEKEVTGVHPAAQLMEFKVSDLTNLSEPVSYELNYRIQNYAIKSGDKFLTFNLPGIMYTAEEVGKKERANPIDFGLKQMTVNQIELEIPEGYKIYYLPPGYKHESKVAIYKATFTKKIPTIFQKLLGTPSFILFSDRYTRKLVTATSEDYYDYKECIETKAKLAKEVIVLYK